MKLFKRQEEEEQAPPPPRAPGPHLLTERGLLASWFISHRLDEELERARRYNRPLAVFVTAPDLLPGEELSVLERHQAASACIASSRRCDLVGWLDSHRILVVMPETDLAEARSASTRLRDDIWRRTQMTHGPKWRCVIIEEAAMYERAKDLFDSLSPRAVDETAA